MVPSVAGSRLGLDQAIKASGGCSPEVPLGRAIQAATGWDGSKALLKRAFPDCWVGSFVFLVETGEG